METLLLPTDAMNIWIDISDMARHAILWFGGYNGRNIEGLGRIGVYVFSIVLIGRLDKNKDYFEEDTYNNPMYNFALAAPANALERMQPLSASDVSGLHILLNILL